MFIWWLLQYYVYLYKKYKLNIMRNLKLSTIVKITVVIIITVLGVLTVLEAITNGTPL